MNTSELNALRLDLPWLINGKLEAERKKLLENLVSENSAVMSERDFLMSLQNSLKQQEYPVTPKDFMWAKIDREIKQYKQISRFKYWKGGAIAAALLLAVQSAYVLIQQKSSPDIYQPLGSQQTAYPVLKIRFVANAKQGDIQALLQKHQLTIVSGPNAAGIYSLTTQGDYQAVLQQLRLRTELIDHVQLD